MVAVLKCLSIALVLSVCPPLVQVASAQLDPVFTRLRDQGIVKWDGTERRWLPVNEKTRDAIVISGDNLVITERFYSQGRDVVVAARFLEMTSNSLISTGFTTKPPQAFACSAIGQKGAPGGHLRVMAVILQSSSFSTTGQEGGPGGTGCEGTPGKKSSMTSENGRDATCTGNRGAAKKGANGTRPSGDGIAPGDGRPGGTGGVGGDGGSLFMTFASLGVGPHSHVTGPSAGGPGGAGGRAGSRGEPGDQGVPGRRIECVATCSASQAKNEGCPQERTEAEGGDPAPRGNYTYGKDGSPGRAAERGTAGTISKTQRSSDEVLALIAPYLKGAP